MGARLQYRCERRERWGKVRKRDMLAVMAEVMVLDMPGMEG